MTCRRFGARFSGDSPSRRRNTHPLSEARVVKLRENVRLAAHTTLGLGGPARYFAECASEEEVRAALEHAARLRLPLFVLGGGSNVVFLEEGFPGVVLHVAIGGIVLRDDAAPEITAGAGAGRGTPVRGAVGRGGAGGGWRPGRPRAAGGAPRPE